MWLGLTNQVLFVLGDLVRVYMHDRLLEVGEGVNGSKTLGGSESTAPAEVNIRQRACHRK